MRNADKTSVVPSRSDSHVRDLLLAGFIGPSPTAAFARSQSGMVRTSGVAAALAVIPGNDDVPRVIRQFTSIFLVSRAGELWRVYDVETPESTDRLMPSADARVPCRLFMALARDEQVRVHRFDQRDSHELDPVSLQGQLEASTIV